MSNYEIFELGAVVLQCGLTLRHAKLAYKTYGKLNATRDNVIVMPSATDLYFRVRDSSRCTRADSCLWRGQKA